MKTISTYGHVDADGNLKITNAASFKSDLSFGMGGCDVEVVIKKRGRRSDQQNRYYWGVVVWTIRMALIDLGHRLSAEDVHDFLKSQFNTEAVIGEGGEVIATIGKSTTSMTKLEFANYIDSIVQWASEKLSISIPTPSSEQMFDFK